MATAVNEYLTFTNYQNELIGTGINFDDPFDSVSGSINYNENVYQINQSIRHILGTRIGTRFFLPEFGSKLYSLVFEPNDDVLKHLLVFYVNEALTQWEPRIYNLSIKPIVKQQENLVPIRIEYQLINTNIAGNYVYPFNRQVYETNSFTPTQNRGNFLLSGGG